MNIDTEFPGRNIKAAQIEGQGDVVYTISRVTKERLGQGADQKDMPILYFQDIDQRFPLNVTNRMTLRNLYGADTVGWVGKPIALYTTDTAMGGKTMRCIRIREQVPSNGQTNIRGAQATTSVPKPKDMAWAAHKTKAPRIPPKVRDEKFKAIVADLLPGQTDTTITDEEWEYVREQIQDNCLETGDLCPV